MDILLNINTALTTTLHNDMLLIKEQLNLPTVFIQFGDFKRSEMKSIGKKDKLSILTFVSVLH